MNNFPKLQNYGIKYLNNRVEPDHRCIKRLTKPGMGFGSFNTARAFHQRIVSDEYAPALDRSKLLTKAMYEHR